MHHYADFIFKKACTRLAKLVHTVGSGVHLDNSTTRQSTKLYSDSLCDTRLAKWCVPLFAYLFILLSSWQMMNIN